MRLPDDVVTRSKPQPVVRPRATESPQPPAVNVSLNHEKSTGTQGFLRAFGITSGFMAALVAAVVGLPILACGGCLISMLAISTSVEDSRSVGRPKQTSAFATVYENAADEQIEGGPKSDSSSLQEAVDTSEMPAGQPRTDIVVVETLPSVDLSDRSNVFDLSVRSNVYIFKELTATVNDQYVRDVRIVDVDGRPVTADVLLENNSGSNWKPSAKFEFVNGYGIVLGYDSISWAFETLPPKRRYTESITFYADRFDDTFRYSPIRRPVDFDVPKFLILTYR